MNSKSASFDAAGPSDFEALLHGALVHVPQRKDMRDEEVARSGDGKQKSLLIVPLQPGWSSLSSSSGTGSRSSGLLFVLAGPAAWVGEVAGGDTAETC